MSDNISSGKVAWNAAEGIIMEISNRRNLSNSFFISGHYKKAFETLVAIKNSVIQSFKAEEREKLRIIEEKFSKVSGILNPGSSKSFNPKIREAFSMAAGFAKKYYSEYNDLLMDLLNARGYLVGEQTDASKMNF